MTPLSAYLIGLIIGSLTFNDSGCGCIVFPVAVAVGVLVL